MTAKNFALLLAYDGAAFRGWQKQPGQVTVQAVVTAIDDERRELTADGLLSVDGLVIYRMNDFRVRTRS